MNPQAAALYQQRLQAQAATPTSTPASPPSAPGLSAFIRPPNGQIPPQLLAQLAQIRPAAPQNPLMSQLMQAQALQVSC